MRTEISGKNVTLRRIQQSFVSEIFEAGLESRGGEFTRWMPWCHENYTVEETHSYASYCENCWESASEYNFAIFDNSDGKFAGTVSINQFNFQHRLVNLGYWIRVSKQNRGIAREAARLLARTAFEDLEINRVEILAALENIPSQKAAQRSGAKYEGILRKRVMIGDRVHDGVLFSFVREDFQN
ncbi:MAG: GNAT family N-acetyltransferase [Pyrinomonadaceae bacterium]|nr:GNAT family N-acetyltransferase [Pyrinomonadaceae bacterium]